MAIVSIFGVKTEKEDNVFVVFFEAEFISRIENTRNAEKGKFLLIATEANKYRTQDEYH